MAGGGGGLRFSHVLNVRQTDADLIVAASKATATRVTQNTESGATADQVRFVGAIKHIDVDGDADALTQTVDDITQGLTGDMSKIVDFNESRDICGLAGLREGHVPGFENIATAVEQGIDGVAVNWRGFYDQKDISNADFQIWADRLQAVADSDEWETAMIEKGLALFIRVGDNFQTWVDGVIASTEELSREIGVDQ
ncbi:hypothetical protein OAN307_c15040 [Octadecabacter antarcticus 307]|uniref:Uncharacterized protein n=1 Tax=Octadecabacter antarcticus 307 TaxID=391626 RepID=M9R5X5_9RHOB|nr:hypothetical protein [Octadecabacter antarcticus]AGI67178.1 hypothetical protein OAN307_c15040 [Octadecabacter antarcticus 307]